MAALTGIIILTAALKPLITTPFRPASLLPLYTEAFTASAAAKGKRVEPTAGPSTGRDAADDCVLWIGEGIGSLCWISRGGLFFCCGVGKEGRFLVVVGSSLESLRLADVPPLLATRPSPRQPTRCWPSVSSRSLSRS
jgi:hypothetical protein